MSVSGFTISKLAKAANVNVETIRYYQRVGLIDKPQKPAHGYRHYPEDTLTRVRFIKRAQRLGFALSEVDELLKLDEEHHIDTRKHAEQKLLIVEENIADLTAIKLLLNNLIDTCNQNENADNNLESGKIIHSLTNKNNLEKLTTARSIPNSVCITDNH